MNTGTLEPRRGERLIDTIEGHHVIDCSTPGHTWIRVYHGSEFRNSIHGRQWAWVNELPEPVKQFAENYARLIS